MENQMCVFMYTLLILCSCDPDPGMLSPPPGLGLEAPKLPSASWQLWPGPRIALPCSLVVFKVLLKCFVRPTLTLKIWYFCRRPRPLLTSVTSLLSNQCSNGKKEEPERSVSERRRREIRCRRRRGSSAEGAWSFHAARSLGERCKLPQRVRAELRRQTTFGAFFGVKMLTSEKRLAIGKTYTWWSFTMSRVVLKGPERRSGRR